MPIYKYRCEKCRSEIEIVQSMVEGRPLCCGAMMTKVPVAPALFYTKDRVGTASRSKGYKKGYSNEFE